MLTDSLDDLGTSKSIKGRRKRRSIDSKDISAVKLNKHVRLARQTTESVTDEPPPTVEPPPETETQSPTTTTTSKTFDSSIYHSVDKQKIRESYSMFTVFYKNMRYKSFKEEAKVTIDDVFGILGGVVSFR